MQLKMILPLISVLFMTSVSVAKRQQRVQEPVQTYLNQILDGASQLHSALLSADVPAVDKSSSEILELTKKAEKVVDNQDLKFTYLLQVLRLVRSSLSQVDEGSEEERTESFRSMFAHVVQIARNYRLKTYRLFFCSKDRSVWLQKSWGAKNPFNTESLKNCGAPIR